MRSRRNRTLAVMLTLALTSIAALLFASPAGVQPKDAEISLVGESATVTAALGITPAGH